MAVCEKHEDMKEKLIQMDLRLGVAERTVITSETIITNLCAKLDTLTNEIKQLIQSHESRIDRLEEERGVNRSAVKYVGERIDSVNAAIKFMAATVVTGLVTFFFWYIQNL